MLKIDDGRILEIRQYTWDEIRSKVGKLHPELEMAIDSYLLDSSYVFTEVFYPFGMDIVDNGELYLPVSGGGRVAITDKILPAVVVSHIINSEEQFIKPLGLILEKNCEFYKQREDRIISHAVMKPGDLVGFSGVLSTDKPVFHRNLRAGIRNIFTLASITDSAGCAKLKKQIGLTSDKPDSYVQHGEIFAEIAAKLGSKWRASVLFFPDKLAARLRDKDYAVADLYNYLLNLHRSSYGIWHNDILIWNDYFGQIEHEKQMSSGGYFPVLDTAKHVFAIAANSVPGFVPTNDENNGPIKLIQKVYLDVYGVSKLSNHYPIIMAAAHIAEQDTLPVYYSFKREFGIRKL